jgi:hypothetical protein
MRIDEQYGFLGAVAMAFAVEFLPDLNLIHHILTAF